MPLHHRSWIAAGGAAGAAVRWGALQWWPVAAGGFPAPVFAINVVGSFVLGVVLAEEARVVRGRAVLRDALAIGFCGGLTTFSTFAVEVAALARSGDTSTAAAYALASVAASVGAIVAGAAAGRRVGALVLPVEGPPEDRA